jgi:mannose-6-phosphate isomerase-like protein (cupin superfamily)
MRLVKKPWGHEEIWAETDKYVGKILYINHGHRLSLQLHERKTETIRVLKGKLTLVLQDSGRDGPLYNKRLLEGETFHISTGTVHRFWAEESDVSLLEVSTPELDDVVRLEDDYKR